MFCSFKPPLESLATVEETVVRDKVRQLNFCFARILYLHSLHSPLIAGTYNLHSLPWPHNNYTDIPCIHRGVVDVVQWVRVIVLDLMIPGFKLKMLLALSDIHFEPVF